MHAKTHVQSQMKLQVILNYINYNKGVAEQLHCSLHVKELKVTKVELERQVGD